MRRSASLGIEAESFAAYMRAFATFPAAAWAAADCELRRHSAFRAGFLCATGWGLSPERSAQVGALVATHVVETVGTQEYAFTPSGFLGRFDEVYGEVAAAEVAPHLGAR